MALAFVPAAYGTGDMAEGGDRMAAGEREFVYCGQRALNAVDPLFEQCHLCAVECGKVFLGFLFGGQVR